MWQTKKKLTNQTGWWKIIHGKIRKIKERWVCLNISKIKGGPNKKNLQLMVHHGKILGLPQLLSWDHSILSPLASFPPEVFCIFIEDPRALYLYPSSCTEATQCNCAYPLHLHCLKACWCGRNNTYSRAIVPETRETWFKKKSSFQWSLIINWFIFTTGKLLIPGIFLQWAKKIDKCYPWNSKHTRSQKNYQCPNTFSMLYAEKIILWLVTAAHFWRVYHFLWLCFV